MSSTTRLALSPIACVFTWKPCLIATSAVPSMSSGVSSVSPWLSGRSTYGSSSHAPCEPSAPSIWRRQIDGALGSHGAWLLEPYVDLPESHGLTLETPEDIEGTAEVAIKHGFQVNTHAIGDRANRVVLDIYERV